MSSRTRPMAVDIRWSYIRAMEHTDKRRATSGLYDHRIPLRATQLPSKDDA